MGRPSVNITDRWIKALVHEGIFEGETRNPAPDTAKSSRLTTATQGKLETYLNDMPKRNGVVADFNPARTAQAENGYEAKNGPLPPIVDTED
ncbi:hypothetical protein [Sphingomonas sp. R86520]|uniref:hypothetical protein n=1 Tax=Sphingomonas sp. R86520 TaxID=3093859 RepID=UPI0036D34293